MLLHERELIENIILKMRRADALDEKNLRHLVSPVEKTAGDILLSSFTPDGRQLVLLGDFTGHGLPSAIGGPLVTYILHDLAARSFSGQEVIETINTQLCAKLPTGIFFACVFLEVESDRGGIRVWNAALPECLLIRGGQIQARASSTLPPLGITKGLDFHTGASSFAVQGGDLFYAYSDGIVEEKGTNGEMFGSERLEAFLIQAARDGWDLQELMGLLDDHAGGADHEDDITLVEIKI